MNIEEFNKELEKLNLVQTSRRIYMTGEYIDEEVEDVRVAIVKNRKNHIIKQVYTTIEGHPRAYKRTSKIVAGLCGHGISPDEIEDIVLYESNNGLCKECIRRSLKKGIVPDIDISISI